MVCSKRQIFPCMLAVLACLQAACSVPVRPDHLAQPNRSSLGRIAVVGAHFEPQYTVDAQITGKGASAAQGALEGAALCAKFLEFREPGVLLALVCAPFGVTFGTLAGASSAATPQQIEAAKAGAQHSIAALKLQESMVEAVLRYGKEMGVSLGRAPQDLGPARFDASASYAQARDAADSVVEVSVLTVTASITGTQQMRVAIGMQARVRVLNTHGGKEVDGFTLRCDDSGPQTPNLWLRDAGRLIKAALDQCAASIAERALDEILFVYHPQRIPDLPDQEPGIPALQTVPPYALRPIEPPLLYRTSSGLSSVRPEFRWEPWPRGFDIVPGSEPGQAQEVRYDLRILSARGRIVYERRDLTEPAHRLEQQLRACATFRWTVRARFRLHDAPRQTEWAGIYFDERVGVVAPWWFRRGDAPTRASFPSSPESFYPLVQTPGPAGCDWQ